MTRKQPELKLIFEPFPTITTPRLSLRQFKVSDCDQFYDLRSNKEVMQFLGRPGLKNIDEAKTFINKARKIKNGDAGIEWAMILKEEDRLIGKLGFWRIMVQHYRAEIGYSMLPQFQGKGLMSEAVSAILEYGFDKMNLHSVEANLDSRNIKSVKLLVKNRFDKEGHTKESYYYDGNFTDTSTYGLLKKNWIKNITPDMT